MRTIKSVSANKKTLVHLAVKAGHALFDKHRSGYVGEEADGDWELFRTTLKSLNKESQSEMGEDAYVDDWEYIIFPSTGKFLDFNIENSKDPSFSNPKIRDRDGKVYVVWAPEGLIRIISM